MDKLQATYNYLKERGSEGLGNDVNEFRTKIQGDSATRAAVYNYLKDNGSEGIGNSPDEFMSIIVPGEQPQTDTAKAKTPSIMDAADTVKSKRIDPRNMTAADFQAQVQEGTKEIQTKREAAQAVYNAPTTQAVIKQTVRLKDRFKNLKEVEDKYYDTDKNRAKAVKLASGQDTEISPTLFKNYVDKMTMDRNTWNATLDGTGTDEGYESYKKNVEANAVRQIQKEDHRATNAGISILKETEDIQKNAERDVKGNALERSFIGGFGRGFGDKFDASTWTFGVRDMQDSKALLKAVDKAEAGEELTPIEEDLLEAAAVNMATKAYLSSTQGRGYKAGTVSSESLPFMIEMLVNPASAAGSSIGSKVARYAMKKYAVKGVAKAAGIGARMIGDVAGAAAMTATTGAVGVAADSNRRQIGNIQFDVDEQGNAVFDTATDREHASTAFWKAYGNQAIERHSEMVGEYFAPILGGVAKGARVVNTKIGLSKVNDFIDNINMTEWSKNVGDFMKRTQWHGTVGQFAEEIVGGVENAILVGDQTIDADKETGIFNPSQMLDTFLGVAAMGVVISGDKTVGYKSEKAKAQQAYDEATKNAQTLFGDKWEDLQAKLIESTPEEMKKIAAEVIANPDYSTEQKRAMLSYAKADIQYTTARKMDERFSSEQTDAMNGYLNTYEEAVSGQQSADVTTTMEQKALRNKLADAFGVEPEIFDATYFAYYNDYHQQAAKMAKENPELADDINTYLINRARITGTEQKYQNEIDRSKAAITDGIKKLTYKNQIISATGTDKEHYFIVDAENAEITSETGEQGSSYRIKQKEGADNMIIIRNSNGEVKPMAISDIQYINDIEDAEQAIANIIAMETESVNNRMATELYNQGRYQPGQTVSIEGESLVVVAADNDNVTIEDAEGKKEVVPARTLREIVNASILKEKYGEERANEIIAGLERKSIPQAIQTDTQTQIDQQPIEAGDIIEITAEDGRKVNIIVTQQDAEGNYFVEPEDGQPIINGEVMPLLSATQINDMRYVEPTEPVKPIQQELIKQAPEELTEEAPIVPKEEAEPQISAEEQERIKAEDAIPSEDLNATITDVFKQLERAKKEAKKPISLENTKQVKARQKAQEAIIRYQAIYDKYDAIKKRREANAKPAQTQSLTDAIAQRDASRAAADEERKQMGFNVAGESAKSKWNSAPKIAGNAAVKTLPNGKTIKGRYVLAPAEAATPSHNALDAFTMSAGFPVNEQGKTVNDRDYQADQAAQIFTEKQVAANYDGQAVEQVPTVSPDGIVYDGNGRVMGSQLAAQNGTDVKYMEALRANAANFGFSPEQVDQVPNARVMFVTDEVLPYTTETFAQFNANEKKSQNTTEKAVANSKKLNEDQVNEIADIIDSYSSIDSLFDSEKGTGDMVMAMQKAGLIGANDVAALMDGEKFSATGREFVTSVMLGSTFSEKQLREMGGNKSLKNAILRAFKPIIANSRVTDYELKEEIGNAISLIYEAKQSGNDVALHLMQKDMFQDDASARYSEFEQILALALEDGVETFRDVVKTYNEKALPLSGGQIDIFSGTVTSKDELKQQIIDYYNAKRNRGSESVQGNVAESTSNGRETDESGRTKPGAVGRESAEQAQGDQSDSSGAVVQGSVGQKTARKSREINVAGKENSNNFALNNQEDGNDQEVRQGTSVLQRVSQTELGGLQEISGAAKSEIDRLAGRSSETQRDERSAEQIDSDIRKYAEVNSLWIPYSDIMSNTPFTSGEESDNYLDTKNNRVIKVNNLIHSHGRISELLNRIDLYNQLFPESHISLIGFTNNSDNGTVYPVFSQQFIDNSKYATESEIESHMNNLGFARTNKAAVYSNGEYIIKDVRPRNILNQDGRIYVIDAEIEKDTTKTSITEADETLSNGTEEQQALTTAIIERLKAQGIDVVNATPEMVEDVLSGREGVTFNESEVNEPQFSIRTNPAPKKTGVGYKAFFLKDGKLYPPMVANPNGEATPVGVWLDADAAPISGASKTGRPKVKAGGKGTQGGSGQLAYRPGWHLGEIPYALQFNRKDENGGSTLFPKDFVWAEVEYAMDEDYQAEAEKRGYTENGKYRHSYAGLPRVPENGSYLYRTNPNPSTDPWIITGAMKVKKILSNEEVDTLVRKAGREPQKRQFLKDLAGQVYGWTDGKTIFLTDKGFNPNTPIHEYTHIWAAAVKKNAPALWANIKELMQQTPMWKEVVSDEAYSSLKENEDDICSEALSRLSGSRNAKTLTDMQSKMMDEAGKDILDIAGAANLFNRVKKAISDFWSWVGENLFNIKKFKNAEEVADRVLYDLANKTELKANTIESDNNIGAVDYKLDNNNCDYYIRYADDIESDFKRGWSSYNFGGDSFEGSKEKLLKDINYYAKKKNGGEFEISGLQIWIDKDTSITDNGEFIYIKNDVATYKLGEFSKNVWVVVDDYNAKNGLSAHLINKNFDNVGDLIKYANEHKWSYDGTGDGESFDPKISRVIFQSTMHGRTMYVIEEGDNTIEENKTVQSALSEEETIIEEAKKNGTYMKAPNGEESNLNERQWVQVRTNAFKKWFGDWENSQDSASKVVDENGEPMVVYHGTPNKSEFTIFDKKKVGIQNDFGIHSKGFYFSPNKRTGDAYRKTDGNIYLEYLDVKNPLYLNSFGNKNELAEYLGVDESVFNESSQGFSIKEQFAGIVTSNIKEKGHDGVFVEYKDKLGEVIAFESTQIKSATDNTGTFDESNPDIRFQIIDENKPGLKLSNKAVGEIFNQFVEDEQDALENVLFNWRDIELTVNRYHGNVQSYKLRGNTGRNRAFSTGIDSAPYTPSKKEFIQWLMSDGPFKGYSVDEEWKENITKLRDIASNLMKKDLSLYKTKDGREIKFKKLNEKEEIEKVRDDKAGSGTVDTSTGSNGVQREEDSLLTNKLRRLEDGEFCNVERIFTENGYFSFTSGEKIESIEDIAYIFSDLETKSIENSFALFVKDGKPTVLHLCIGAFNQTMVSVPPIKLAYDTIKPDQVYLVHNHPSGSVFASDADVKILKDINKALRTQAKGIIIDTTSGKFGVFDASGRGEPKAKTESSPNQVSIPIKVYSFDRQVFSKDYNPTGARIYTEEDVAAFISSHRLGKRNKVNMLIISNAGNVVANLFTDKTMIKIRDEDFAHEIVNTITAFGGSSVILYGDFEASLTGIAFLKDEVGAISANQFRLLDFVTIEGLNSQEEKEESLLKEPTTDNYSESKAFHQDIAANGIKILSDQKADDMLNDIYKNITSKERDIIRGLISDGLNKADAIRKWMSDFAANGWNDTANAEIRSTIIDAIAKNVESGYMSANDARFTAWRFGKDDTVSYEDFADMVSMELETRTGAYTKDAEKTDSDYPSPKIIPDQSKELYDKAIGKKSFKFFEAWFVGGASVEEMQKAIEEATKTTISDANNVALVMSHQQSINQSKIENFINRYYTPLIETIGEIKKKLGISGEAVEDYMMMKHGLERNIKLAFRDALRDQHTRHGHIDYAAVDADNAAYGADQEKKDNDIEYAKGDISYEQHRAVDDAIREKYAPSYTMYRNKDYSGLMIVTEAGSLMDAELQALEAVREFERRAGDLKDNLWSRVKAATTHTTKVNYDSGVISRDTYRRLNDMFEYYIPLKGFDELTSDDVYEYMGPDHSLFTATMKGAKGRASKADSPLAMIGSDAVASIMRGSKNLLKQRLYRIAINNPSQLLTTKDMWFVKGPNGWHPAAPDFSSLKENSSATEYNALIDDFERRMKELENEGMATHKTQGLKMDLITLPEYAQEHVVRVMVNGKEKLVYINANPRAAQAINGTLRKQDVDGMHKFIYEFSRQLAANFTTRSIKFIGRNAIKDTLFAHAMISINEGKEYRSRFNRTQARLLNPLSKKNLRMSTLLYRLKKDTLDMSDPIQRYFKEFSQFGGETGYSRLLGVEDFREIIRKSYQAIDGAIPATVEGAWDKFNEVINFANRMAEVVNRFAVYKTSREMGRTIDRSIHDAKEVTANFNEKGIGDKTGLTNFFKTMYLFVNAALQSLRKLGTSYKNHPGRATWVTGKYIAAGFMIPMMNKMMFSMLGDDGDDEWYDLLPKYTRRNNICLATPGIAVTMPLPIELRAYYALGEIVYSLTAGDYVSEEDWMDLATTILDSTLPKSPIDRNVSLMTKVAPDFLAPIMQAYVTNENFVGNPIYKKMASKDAPEFTRIYDRTGKMYVKISKTLNTLGGGDDVHRGAEITQINPAKMEHVIEGYLGGALTSIKDPIMMFIDFINGDEKVDARNVPVLNGVTYKLSDRDIDRIEKETGVRINEDARDDIKISRKTRDAKKRYEEEYAMLNHDFKGYSNIADKDEDAKAKLDEFVGSKEYQRMMTLKTLLSEIRKWERFIDNVEKGEIDVGDDVLLQYRVNRAKAYRNLEDTMTSLYGDK